MSIKLVGILNVTPDSFSDGGLYLEHESALARARELVEGGADIVDIGGQSTRPGSQDVGSKVELERIGKLIAPISEFIPVSVDTYRAGVAREVIKLGASYINDTTSGFDPEMFPVVADSEAKIILMYSSQKAPHGFLFLEDPNPASKGDIIKVISDFFTERINKALSHGVRKDQIILDPGMGAFVSKDPAVSYELISRFKELTIFNLPLMFASSRKGFLKRDGEGAITERDSLSALSGYIIGKAFDFAGPDFIRTHNPKLQREFLEFGR